MTLDIRLSTNFLDHPKVVKLERRLGYPGIKALLRLWFYAREHHPAGRLDGLDVEGVEIAARWEGVGGKFVETLAELKLLDASGEAFSIHDWEENNPFSAEARARADKAKRAAVARWKAQPGPMLEHCSSIAQATVEQCSSDAQALLKHRSSNARNGTERSTPPPIYPPPSGGDGVTASPSVPDPGRPEKAKGGQDEARAQAVYDRYRLAVKTANPSKRKRVSVNIRRAVAELRMADAKDGLERSDDERYEELGRAAERYARSPACVDREPRYRFAAVNFYAEGGAWLEYLRDDAPAMKAETRKTGSRKPPGAPDAREPPRLPEMVPCVKCGGMARKMDDGRLSCKWCDEEAEAGGS